MKRYFYMLAALAIAACQQPVQPDMAPGKVQVEPVITRATEVNFENGDQIGFTMTKVNGTEAYADNAILTFDGSVFSGDLMWYADAYSDLTCMPIIHIPKTALLLNIFCMKIRRKALQRQTSWQRQSRESSLL
mgnify:CR=1 FL=1